LRGKLIRFKDSKTGCWSRVDNADPIYISVAQEGILIRRSRLGILGPILYRSKDLTETARICAELNSSIDEYATPPQIQNPVLMLFTQLALESGSAAQLSARIASALDILKGDSNR
jgi:hypothetical protein